MYKMITVDMDGTLLKPDGSISRRNKEAVEKAKDKGVKVVITSGRPIEGILDSLDKLGLNTNSDYVISYNGCVVQNSYTKEIIYKKTLKGSDLKKLYKYSKSLDVNIHAFSREGCITPKLNKYTELEEKLNGIKVKECDYTTVDNNEDIIKIMFTGDSSQLDKGEKNINNDIRKNYTVVRSLYCFLEFLNNKSNKGEAVRRLATHLDIAPENIMAIGDAGNDKHMLEFAGLGVAMGNATEEIKQVADVIVSTNERDGVAEAIEKFVLESN